jgi:serine/threonine protein phosphatase PrpC
LASARFEEEELAFGEGDLVVFVSDGITEALDASGNGVVDAIAAQIAEAHRPTPDAVCARLLAAARRGSGPDGVDGWMDDRTALVFGVTA